jgi:predicted PurR-regulated permease PerM
MVDDWRKHGSLDQISQSIGAIQADIKNLSQNFDRMISYMKESNATLTKSLAEHEERDEQDFTALQKDVSELKGFRNGVIGMASALGVLGSTAMHFVFKKLDI